MLKLLNRWLKPNPVATQLRKLANAIDRGDHAYPTAAKVEMTILGDEWMGDPQIYTIIKKFNEDPTQ